MPNRLANESSPYLRQHAENPVDWYPWGDEALSRASSEDRPILLSVGYSSCHWCHVMEAESFEDRATAELMNQSFVNVKVDREERPDIDQVYMKAVQAMTGRGGWPMTVFLTPERVPFFGGTYYPPEPRPGIPSFRQVLEAVNDAWKNRREDVAAGSARLLEALRRTAAPGGRGSAGSQTLDRTAQTLGNQFDATHGGFGDAPKFPQPVTLDFLLRYHRRTGDPKALEMAVLTLRRMAAGGVRDHLGGGFHRYSVDARWLVPHFEKMLYDNALLAEAYLEAYRLTDSDDLREVCIDTLDYLSTDLRSPEGGFYAARDADSEGEEGRYYVWSRREIDDVLGAEEGRLFANVYGATERGNFEGRNILHLPVAVDVKATEAGVGQTELERRLRRARTRLLESRAERDAPFRDEKTIVSWNGLAIRAFADAGALLGRQDYLDTARRAADFLLTELWAPEEGLLLHSWIDGIAGGHGFLDDYASLGNALLTLHGATLQYRWLDAAVALCDQVVERFWDDSVGTVFDTASDSEALIVRPREPMDNPTPSGPSLAAELMLRVGRITADARLSDRARAIVDHEADALMRFGPAFGRMLVVLESLESPSTEIVVVGRDDDRTRELIRAVHDAAPAGAVIAGSMAAEARGDDARPGVALLRDRTLVDGAPGVYVCRDHACRLPVTEPAAVREELAALSS